MDDSIWAVLIPAIIVAGSIAFFYLSNLIDYLIRQSSTSLHQYKCPHCGHGVEETALQSILLKPNALFPYIKLTCPRCGYKGVRHPLAWH